MVNEYQTTQMCHKCGSINKNVGNSDVYECVSHDEKKVSCGKYARDINAAKNMFMKGVLKVFIKYPG